MGGGISKFGYHNYKTFGGEDEIYSLVKASRHQRYFNYHFSRSQYDLYVIKDTANSTKSERDLNRVNVINTKDYIVISGVKSAKDNETAVNELLKGLRNVPIIKNTNLKGQLLRALNRNNLNSTNQRVKYGITKENITRRGQHGFEIIGNRYYFDIYIKKPKR